LQALYQTGVLSKFSNPLTVLTIKLLHRCDATPDDLDSGTGHRRTHEKTDFLIKNFDSGVPWDAFGINEDIVVCDDILEQFPRLIL
jgi:hypothetical protein